MIRPRDGRMGAGSVSGAPNHILMCSVIVYCVILHYLMYVIV